MHPWIKWIGLRSNGSVDRVDFIGVQVSDLKSQVLKVINPIVPIADVNRVILDTAMTRSTGDGNICSRHFVSPVIVGQFGQSLLYMSLGQIVSSDIE